MEKIILDVGSLNGDFLNQNAKVYAFEPNPQAAQKLAKFCQNKPNCHIIQKAVTLNDGEIDFYISTDTGCSSIYPFKDNLDNWKVDDPSIWGYRKLKKLKNGKTAYRYFETEEKIKVPSIRLDTFIEQEKIPYISYLHVDAQGADLDVLKSLGVYLHYVREGVVEAAVTKDDMLYTDGHDLEEIKSFLQNNNFRITKIQPNNPLKNEVNVYFKNQLN